MAGKNAQTPPEATSIMRTCNRKYMAELLGVSLVTVDNLANDGKIVRLRPGEFDMVESVRTYTAYLRNVAGNRSGDDDANLNLTEQRAKLARAQTEAQEFKNQIAQGEYVKADEVERTWADFLRNLRSRVLAVPSRVRQVVPTLTAHDAGLIDRELRDVLTGLANGDDA